MSNNNIDEKTTDVNKQQTMSIIPGNEWWGKITVVIVSIFLGCGSSIKVINEIYDLFLIFIIVPVVWLQLNIEIGYPLSSWKHTHVCPTVQVPIDVDEFSNVMIYIASPPGIFRPLSLAVTYSSWSQHCTIAANWVHCAINCWVKNIVLLSHQLHTLFFRCLEPYLNRPSISLKK